NNPEFDPKNPEFRTFEGAYYLLEVNADDLVFEHSGHIGGMILDYDKSSTGWNERHCVIAQYAVNPRGSQFHPGKLAGWLERQIAKYPPNWFSVT
ncbi:MAG: hypothetical protein QGI36_06160, partial [Candidatus Thalassarchaeaceae archaeon]|nr:hypothetical protein [Candidatus Thalassarchaeaceae archaeon]